MDLCAAISQLEHNYPNPFNSSTVIPFSLAAPGLVRVEILDPIGQGVKTLVDESRSSGFHQVGWDGTDRRGDEVAAGLYFVRLQTPLGDSVRKMTLLK